jgi:hypothetical protein
VKHHRTKLEAEQFLEAEADRNLKVTTLRMSRCFPEPAPIMAMYRLHRGIDSRDVAEGHRQVLGWSPSYGFEELTQLLDAHIPEVLPE